MSRARMCSAAGVSNGDNGSGTRASLAKPADDTHARTVRPNHESKRSRSRNKIPKSVRYDLENSLVGLCDVWFEEIKPHLVRNNIKLHVHGVEASGSASAGCASGDYEQQATPTSPGCSHLDPGAASDRLRRKSVSYVDSCSTRRTASKAPFRKLRAPAPRQDHQPAVSTTEAPREHVQTQRPFSETTEVQRPHSMATTRKKKRNTQAQFRSNWRVPRLCRTSSVHSSTVGQPTPRPVDDVYVRQLYKSIYNKDHRWIATKKNRGTQTKTPPSPGLVDDYAFKSGSSGRRMQSPNSRSSQQRAKPAMESPTHYQTYHKSYQNQQNFKEPVLFDNDLIDIIGEKHEERLKIIYNSPEQVKYPSILNLVSPNNRQRKHERGGPKKIPPWR